MAMEATHLARPLGCKPELIEVKMDDGSSVYTVQSGWAQINCICVSGGDSATTPAEASRKWNARFQQKPGEFQ